MIESLKGSNYGKTPLQKKRGSYLKAIEEAGALIKGQWCMKEIFFAPKLPKKLFLN